MIKKLRHALVAFAVCSALSISSTYAEEGSVVTNWEGTYKMVNDEILIQSDLSFQYSVHSSEGESCEVKGQFALADNQLKFEDADKQCKLGFKQVEGKYFELDIEGCLQYCTSNAFMINGIFDKM